MGRYTATGARRDYSGPEKRASRSYLVDVWQRFAGRSSLPPDRQYWTMCGPMTHAGKLTFGCELSQLSREGLFTPAQFIGVEIDPKAHAENVRAVRKLRGGRRPTLINDDIIEALHRALDDRTLRPGIVHLDTVSEAPRAIELLREALGVLMYVDGPMMVVWNFRSRRIAKRYIAYPWDARDRGATAPTIHYVKDLLAADALLMDRLRHRWTMFPEQGSTFEGFRYQSTVDSQMTSYVFVRRARACKEGCRCSG